MRKRVIETIKCNSRRLSKLKVSIEREWNRIVWGLIFIRELTLFEFVIEGDWQIEPFVDFRWVLEGVSFSFIVLISENELFKDVFFIERDSEKIFIGSLIFICILRFNCFNRENRIGFVFKRFVEFEPSWKSERGLIGVRQFSFVNE